MVAAEFGAINDEGGMTGAALESAVLAALVAPGVLADMSVEVEVEPALESVEIDETEVLNVVKLDAEAN